MAVVQPFRALRYDEAKAGPVERLVAPPYDVISPQERVEYLRRSPFNVVHLTLPESEEEAARLLRDWRREGVLVEDDEPALWALEQTFVGPDGAERTRTGLAASLRVEPYETRAVLPHERTHAGPREGRLRLLRATRTQLEPIFLLHQGETLLRGDGPPTIETSEGGVVSRLWRIAGPARVRAVQEALRDRQLLIADGHHRYETALAFREEDGADSMLVVLVGEEQDGLAIFPTHRIADGAELPGGAHGGGDPLDELRRLGAVARDEAAAVVYRPGGAFTLGGTDGELDTELVERVARGTVTYTPDAREAIAAVDSGAAGAAFLLRAATIEQVRAVAERGDVMPQKSTYFFPKLTSGLLFHPL